MFLRAKEKTMNRFVEWAKGLTWMAWAILLLGILLIMSIGVSWYREDKVMLGFSDDIAARDAFLAHYQDATHLGKITKMTWEDFLAAIKTHKRGTRITK